MDVSGFFGVVATIDFALLGLWWVTVQARPDLRRESQAGRAAYVVSLQFVVPGTAALLAQVAPNATTVWRISFAVAGVSAAIAIWLFVPMLVAGGAPTMARVLRFGAAPMYLAIAVIAAAADSFSSNTQLRPLQVEAILFCVITFLATEVAWAAAMAPEGTQAQVPEGASSAWDGRRSR